MSELRMPSLGVDIQFGTIDARIRKSVEIESFAARIETGQLNHERTR